MGHGKGFQVLVLEAGSRQKINVFVADQDMNAATFHGHLVQALEATGGKLALGRIMLSAEDGTTTGRPGAEVKPKKRDMAQEDEDDWLSSVMGRCMVPKKEERPEKGDAPASAAEGAPADGEGEGEAKPEPKPKAKDKKNVPPWLRR